MSLHLFPVPINNFTVPSLVYDLDGQDREYVLVILYYVPYTLSSILFYVFIYLLFPTYCSVVAFELVDRRIRFPFEDVLVTERGILS